MSKRSLTTQNLAPEEALFVREFAYSAGSRTDATVAAIRAGVPRKEAEARAEEWLAQPNIVDALHATVRERLDIEVVSALQTLVDLASSARSESVRAQAAAQIIDRSSIGPIVSRSASLHHHSGQVSIEDRIKEVRAKILEGTYAEVEEE